MSDSPRQRPVVLCVLDGFGDRAEEEGNAVLLAKTPALDALAQNCPKTVLAASGAAVGAAGQRASSALGHRLLGAGRSLQSDCSRIDAAIEENQLGRNEVLDQTMRICLYDKCALHLFGLLSDGGVHASMDHLFAIIDIADFHEIPVIVHAILDGRDVGSRTAMTYLERLLTQLEGKDASIATLSGRHYAMDRDGRWDRVYQAYHAIVRDKVLGPVAPQAETPFEAVATSYSNDLSDEFLVPIRIGDYSGIKGDYLCDFAAEGSPWEWTGEEVGVATNFRGDRMLQLSQMLTRLQLPPEVAADLLMDRQYPMRGFREHCYATISDYGLEVPAFFARAPLDQGLASLIAAAGLKQLRCGETEKAPHITDFFNGRAGKPDVGEQRLLLPSPRLVDSYDEKPQLGVAALADKVCAALREGETDFILVNFANPDLVGHTGKLQATIAAVEAVDAALAEVVATVREQEAALVVTASHGNCEQMIQDDGTPHTGHTDNPVPLIVLGAGEDDKLRDGGSLVDVAPTVLALLGIDQPEAMSGKTLLVVE